MNERRYFLVFLLVAGTLLGAAALVSFTGDPEGVFGRHIHEREIAAALLSGKNVVNFNNYDGRVIQKYLIRNDTQKRGAIVLGSSRSMQIRNSSAIGPLVRDQSFFNYAVSGATIEDDIALLELYLEKEGAPGTVIIGADPWILNTNNGFTKWRSLENEYFEGLARINATPVVPEPASSAITRETDRYAALLSGPILFRSIDVLLSESYYPTDQAQADGFLKMTDGSVVWPNSARDATVEEIDRAAQEFADTHPLAMLGDFSRLDRGLESRFEATVRYLKGRHTTVVLYLPPYHPIAYETLATDPRYACVGEAESYFREVASRERIAVIGSYDPARLNLTSIDFFDGWHLKGEAIERVFSTEVVGGTENSSASAPGAGAAG
jgi:hypothetical protein